MKSKQMTPTAEINLEQIDGGVEVTAFLSGAHRKGGGNSAAMPSGKIEEVPGAGASIELILHISNCEAQILADQLRAFGFKGRNIRQLARLSGR